MKVYFSDIFNVSPDDIEEYIISPKDIELPFMDFFINQRKYNL